MHPRTTIIVIVLAFWATSLLATCLGAPRDSREAAVPDDHSATRRTSIAGRYGEIARRIVEATLAGNQGYERLEDLCVRIGHRLSGSRGLERAIDWAVATMKADGQENVRAEPVMVPHWVRGEESATMVEPRVQSLTMLGLGGSVGTPPGGITAPVFCVADKAELDALGDAADGKIVLFNTPMPAYHPARGSGYGTVWKYRVHGADMVAGHGGVASLVRSLTATSLSTPHTGTMSYADGVTKIPAAAITVENAETIARLCKKGIPVVVNLKMQARTLPDVESANVIGELRGSTLPEEVVVIGGHFDSWDVGHGAHDDGGGCVMAMEVINVLRKLKLTPRRTIRVVLFTNEENGVRGGKAYAKDHADELGLHVAAIESDSGVFSPRGLGTSCSNEDRQAVAVSQMGEIMDLLAPMIGEKLEARTGGGGVDIGPMGPAGVVLIGHRMESSKYFHYHHSPADTIDKVDPEIMSKNVAMLAAATFILADMPERLGSTAP